MRDRKLMMGRSVVSLAIIGLAAIGWLINDHSVAIMSFLSRIPREQIADLGIEPMQTVTVAMYKLPLAIMFCAMLASLVEKMLRQDAFGNLSRWGLLFITFLYCFSQFAR